VNQSNSPVDRRKFEICPFDHPWRELDYLFCWERLLRDQPAHYSIADA
jgi:hypothetical protein